MPKLILFDIDGTLLASGGAGQRALRLAIRERFGDGDLARFEIAGRTDSGIARQVLARHGIEPTAFAISELLERYLRFLEGELPKTDIAVGRVLPGILPLLDRLIAHPDVALGLLTGNLERGAEMKLTHYGLWSYFKFGAYADDHHDRNELGKFARLRAREKHGVEFANSDVFILGDTPHDIACARAIDAKAVAIATGDYSFEQLANHQPDFLFHDLGDIEKALAIFGLT